MPFSHIKLIGLIGCFYVPTIVGIIIFKEEIICKNILAYNTIFAGIILTYNSLCAAILPANNNLFAGILQKKMLVKKEA